MILTGKAKEDFLKYFKKRNKIKYAKIDLLEFNFNCLDALYQNSLIIEFFDTKGIYINTTYEEYEDLQVRHLPVIIKEWSCWVNDNFLPCFNSRQEAITKAIEKSNEIYNSNYEIY